MTVGDVIWIGLTAAVVAVGTVIVVGVIAAVFSAPIDDEDDHLPGGPWP
ncbi:MAG: hypothetical protein WDN25_13255 [Acetobacteraceae bacterium]